MKRLHDKRVSDFEVLDVQIIRRHIKKLSAMLYAMVILYTLTAYPALSPMGEGHRIDLR